MGRRVSTESLAEKETEMSSISIRFNDEADRGMFVKLLAEAIGKALDGRSKACQVEVVQAKAESVERMSLPRNEP